MDPHSGLFVLNISPAPNLHVATCNVSDVDYVMGLSERVKRLTVFHRNISVLQSLRSRLRFHPGATVSESIFPDDAPDQFELAIVQIPKSRGLSRAMLFTCLNSLRVDGRLYAAGPNTGGANTAQSDLGALVGSDVPTLATKARHRIFSASRPAILEAPAEWNAPWEAKAHTFSVANDSYDVYTQPGVFSHDHPDPGTLLLIETLFPRLRDASRRWNILDAACGYGLLGFVAGRELRPAHVVFADIDLLALSCLRKTLPEAIIVSCDLTQPPSLPHAPFDLILCNPPFHQEHAKDLSFLHAFAPHARRLLSPRGQFALVANSFLPYRKLLAAHFSTVETLAITPIYQVLSCRP